MFAVGRLDLQLHFRVADRIENLVQTQRQSHQKILQFQDRSQQLGRRKILEHPLAHGIADIAAYRFIRVETRRQGSAHLVQLQQCLAKHRQLGRHVESRFGRHPADFEQRLAHIHLLQRAVLLFRD